MKENKIFKEIERFGFLNGKIKFGEYTYNIELMPMAVYNRYIGLIDEGKSDDAKQYYEAFQYICDHCLYREVEFKTKLQKIFNKPGVTIRTYDFELDKYPYVLCDKFINDMFKVLVDKTFFQCLLEWGSVEKEELEK